MDETDPQLAETNGYYVVKFWERHKEDSQNQLTKDCRYWPDIKAKLSNGSTGGQWLVSPNKAEATVKKGRATWITGEVNLFLDTIVGPFNFQRVGNQAHRIPGKVWQEFKNKSEQMDVDGKEAFLVSPI